MIWNRERRAIREGRKEEKGREKCCNRIIVSKIKTEKQKKEYIYIYSKILFFKSIVKLLVSLSLRKGSHRNGSAYLLYKKDNP